MKDWQNSQKSEFSIFIFFGVSMFSNKIEEYIQAIFILEKENKIARTKDIAMVLQIKPSSVTEMLQKLKHSELVIYKLYCGAYLTPKGKKFAKELFTKQNAIIEVFEILGVNKKLAESEASQISHLIDQQTLNKMTKFVEFVKNSPQNPIWLEHYVYFCETGKRLECVMN